MAQDYNNNVPWQFAKLVEMAKEASKKKGLSRTEHCKTALVLVEQVRLMAYTTSSESIFDIFNSCVSNISAYLDGNISIIEEATRSYFLLRHCKNMGLDEATFSIEFSNKNSGIQTGLVCKVKSPHSSIRYFVKTHQYGPTSEQSKCMQPPDGKELFVYKLLESIEVCPEVHFILPSHGSKRTIYIATKEVDLCLISNLRLQTTSSSSSSCRKESNRTSEHDNESAADSRHTTFPIGTITNTTSLHQMDLLARILCLSDCTTNSSNCGQIMNTGAPVIIDFRIETQNNYFKPDILQRFLSSNNEFNYEAIPQMHQTLTMTSEAEKRALIKSSFIEWKLSEKIDQVTCWLEDLILRYSEYITFTNDVSKYAIEVKSSIDAISSTL
jgi:hypothetical protein